MISPSASGHDPARISVEEWDKLRHEFQQSMLVDTSLRSLAENIDGCSWPSDDPDETPARFIELTRGEALARLKMQGLPPAKLDLLADILRGTMAFDASFGDMLEIARKAEADSDIVHRNLDRLGIPRDFPSRLCNFTAGMHRFCAQENLGSLQEFPNFRRHAANPDAIDEEFRNLLNALTHIDESAIARFLPYRARTSGLYFVEAIGLVVRGLPADERARIARDPASLAPDLRARIAEYADYFAEQTTRIRAAHAAGTPLDRLVAPLDDLALEPAVAALLGLVLNPRPPRTAAPSPASAKTPKAPGFFVRLLKSLRV